MFRLARLLAFAALLSPLPGGAATTYYKVHMTGAATAVATSADATAILSFEQPTNVFTWVVNHRGISSAGTGLHLHASGQPLLSGDVDIDLPFAASPFTGTRVLTNLEMNGVALARWTLEIRTTQYPGGEIRGPRLIQGPVAGYSFGLDGTQAGAPGSPIATDGSGHANVTLNVATSQLTWDVNLSNLSSPATQIDFHGPAGRFATGAVTIGVGLQGSTVLDPASAADLLNEMWYIDVHTANHPSGEIRGQIVEPVTVQVTVIGDGRVASDPPGIDCPGNCSRAFDEQAFVTLTALPGPGAVLNQWTNGCTGTDVVCGSSARGLSFVTAEFAAPQAPAFTSAATATFNSGPSGSFQVSVSGSPKPTLTLTGTLPSGIVFNSLTRTLGGFVPSSLPAGSYPITFRASNSVGLVDQAFTIKVQGSVSQVIYFNAPPPMYVGTVVSLSAFASSDLPVAITNETPAVCSLNGSVLLALAPGTCILDADQPGSSVYAAASQKKVSVAIYSTAPGFASADSTTGYQGLALAFTFQVTGQPTPTISLTGALPAGVSFSGTGLTGVPAVGTVATYPLTVRASNGNGPDATQSFTLVVAPASGGRLINMSTRMKIGLDNDVMIAGFVVGGTTPKKVVVNVAGPSLAQFFSDAIPGPTLTLTHPDGTVIATNVNWKTQANPADVEALAASGFQPSRDDEPAIITTLDPGAYTAIVRGAQCCYIVTSHQLYYSYWTGVGLVGVFEVDHPETPLINISTRGQVLTDNDVMISGFIIADAPMKIIVSAAGPSLANFGIANALANPTIALVRNSDYAIIAANDDWQVQANPADAAAIQASGFQPGNAREPAIIATLPPGAYTAIVSGVNGTTGVGLVGVFAVP